MGRYDAWIFTVFRSDIEDQRPCGVATPCGCGRTHACSMPTHWRLVNPLNEVKPVCVRHLPDKHHRSVIKNPFANA